MFDHNFFYWLIQGIIDLAFTVLNRFPNHVEWGLSQMFLSRVAISILLTVSLVGSFVRLSTFAIVITIVLLLEGVRAIMAIYRWIVDLIPMP